MTRRLLSRVADATRAVGPVRGVEALTPREPAVRVAVAGGLGSEAGAGALLLSGAAGKTHVSRVMAKLGARDRAQLVVAAYESGVVRPGWAG